MSVRTPFTNVNGGKEESRYGGKNKILRGWYDSKQFKGVNNQGFALNKINQSNDIYSQFSCKQSVRKGFQTIDPREGTPGTSYSVLSDTNSITLESLRQNEFFP